jgi:hypothetical protein
MASSGYLGPDQVQALIGQWVDVVGADVQLLNNPQNDSSYWKHRPAWWTQSKNDWDRLPDWQQRQLWQTGPQGYAAPQYGYGYGYPQAPQYGYGYQPQSPYPYGQQYSYGYTQPSAPGPAVGPVIRDHRTTASSTIDPTGKYVWVPASFGVAGHWVLASTPRAASSFFGNAINNFFGTPTTTPGTVPGAAVVRDHRVSAGQWMDIVGQQVPVGPGVGPFGPAWQHPFPPSAMIVDAPMPTQANRDILPMSTGVPILPTQSAQITGRPQTLVFKIGRFVISNAGTAGGSADWIVNDIKIGNRSQFVQSGDVPGDLFAVNAIDTFVRFETAQTAMDVVVVVTYIGLNESGAPFFGAMVGTAAV